MLIQDEHRHPPSFRTGAKSKRVASAVIGGITDSTFTTVRRKLRSRSRSRSRPAAAHEKLQRLETLVLKLCCAVEASEKHAIGSASLLEQRDRLREAAAEGGAVVLDFQRRAREEEENGEAAAMSASASVPGQQQPAGALYFTRSALCGMAQRVRDATRRLFSTGEDMEKLDGTLERMERLTPDIKQFLFRLTSSAADAEFNPVIRMVSGSVATDEIVGRQNSALPSSPSDEAREDREREARLLARVLERTLRRMVSDTKATDGRDMEGLEWLAEWAAVRREAVERGNAVLQTLRPGSVVIHKADGGALEEDGELYSFARAVQRLARDDPCFAVLCGYAPATANNTRH